MIPKECKRLAEVDFPIAALSAHSERDESIPARPSQHAPPVVGVADSSTNGTAMSMTLP